MVVGRWTGRALLARFAEDPAGRRLERMLGRLDEMQRVGELLDWRLIAQQSREEMEVLFTLLAERYERRSVIITSNLVFSQWEQIFKDPMTTAAAIDRVVHHSRCPVLLVPAGREPEPPPL